MNGKEQSELPEDDYDVNDHDDNKIYYKVNVTCDNEVEAEWDYNAWNLKITNLDSGKAVNGTKCKLSFDNSQVGGILGMSATERDNIIKQGVQIRRNTYRGKNITSYLENGKLFDMIKSGKFDDVYVGDYVVSNNKDSSGSNIVWLIADLDNYLGVGDQGNGLQQHHATIIPSYLLQSSRMNPTNSTKVGASEVSGAEDLAGYMGSEMYQKTLEEVYNRYIVPDFANGENHVIEYRNLVSYLVDLNLSNQFGNTGGASTDWKWDDRKLDLMSEVNVYGTTVWSSSGYDIGLDNRQYAIFQLRPELINQDLSGISGATTRRYTYWLKAVNSSSYFAFVGSAGDAGSRGDASISFGVRPRFLID